MRFLQLTLVAAVIMLLLDTLWITVISKDFYQKKLGFLLRPKAHIGAAAGFYVVYLLGLVYFTASWTRSPGEAALNGAFFGLVAYATYDLTNAATVKNWPWIIVAIDLVWGTALSAITAGLSYLIVGYL